MSHQQGDFRLAGSLAHQRVIDIFNQRFGHILRHCRRGKQTILVAVFQLRQHLPLLIAGDLPPRHLIFREAFIILQGEGVYQRVAHLQRSGHSRLLLITGAKGIFTLAQGTDLLLFAGGRVAVIDHRLQQLVALGQLHSLALFFHRLQRFLAKRRGVVGNNRVEGRVHGAHLRLVMHRDAAARERAGDKELRGGDGALQAVSVGINRVFRRALAAGHQLLLRQPFAHIVAHIHLQHTAFGGQLAARHIPLRPGLGGGLLQHAAVIGQRRTQVVTTHDQHLLQLIPLRGGRVLRLSASG